MKAVIGSVTVVFSFIASWMIVLLFSFQAPTQELEWKYPIRTLAFNAYSIISIAIYPLSGVPLIILKRLTSISFRFILISYILLPFVIAAAGILVDSLL